MIRLSTRSEILLWELDVELLMVGWRLYGNDVLLRTFLKGYHEKLNPTKLECPKIKIEIYHVSTADTQR